MDNSLSGWWEKRRAKKRTKQYIDAWFERFELIRLMNPGLAKLDELGELLRDLRYVPSAVGEIDKEQALSILRVWYRQVWVLGECLDSGSVGTKKAGRRLREILCDGRKLAISMGLSDLGEMVGEVERGLELVGYKHVGRLVDPRASLARIDRYLNPPHYEGGSSKESDELHAVLLPLFPWGRKKKKEE